MRDFNPGGSARSAAGEAADPADATRETNGTDAATLNIGRYRASWIHEDGEAPALTTPGDHAGEFGVAVIDGGTGELVYPTPMGASVRSLELNGTSQSVSLRGAVQVDGLRAAALASSQLAAIVVAGQSAASSSDGEAAITDIDTCTLSGMLRIAPKLHEASELRVADGSLCDAAGVRRVLETYREQYSQLPEDTPIRMLLFEDGLGTEALARQWEEAEGARAGPASTRTDQSRSAAPFALAGSVVAGDELYVGGEKRLAFRTASGRLSASIDPRLENRPFEVGLFSLRRPAGVSDQRARSNPPFEYDLAYWKKFYDDVASDAADIFGMQGARDVQVRSRRCRRGTRSFHAARAHRTTPVLRMAGALQTIWGAPPPATA